MAPTLPVPRPEAGPRLRVLLVEDNPGDTQLVHEALAESDLPVDLRAFADAPSAIASLVGGRSDRPALVVCDFDLGGQGSALDLLKVCGEDPSLARLPVVVFTSSANPADREACLEAGAAGYVVKPMDADAYFDAVRHIVTAWGGPPVPTLT